MQHRRWIHETHRRIAAIVAAAVVLGACGSNDDGNADDDRSPDESGVDAVTTEVTQAAGGAVTTSPGPTDPAGSDPEEATSTEGTIKIGAILDFTGPFSAASPSFQDGLEAWKEHVNAAGGIDGQAVELVYEDGQADPNAAGAAATKLISQDGVFAIACVLGSSAAVAAADAAEAHDVLVLPCAYSDQLFEPPRSNVFVAATPYASQIARGVEVLAERTDASSAAIVYSSDEFGESGRRGAEAAFDALSLEQIASESFDRGAQDLQAQAQSVVRADPELVVCVCVYSQSGLLAQAMDRLGAGDVPIVAPNPTVGPPFFTVAEDAGGSVYATDYVAHEGTLGWDDAAAAMQAAFDRDPSAFELLGLLNLAVLTEAMSSVDGELTTGNVTAVLEGFDGREIPGLAVPVTFGSDRRFAAGEVAVYQAEPASEEWTLVAEPEAPASLE